MLQKLTAQMLKKKATQIWFNQGSTFTFFEKKKTEEEGNEEEQLWGKPMANFLNIYSVSCRESFFQKVKTIIPQIYFLNASSNHLGITVTFILFLKVLIIQSTLWWKTFIMIKSHPYKITFFKEARCPRLTNQIVAPEMIFLMNPWRKMWWNFI